MAPVFPVNSVSSVVYVAPWLSVCSVVYVFL